MWDEPPVPVVHDHHGKPFTPWLGGSVSTWFDRDFHIRTIRA
jgi:hypothetical protein